MRERIVKSPEEGGIEYTDVWSMEEYVDWLDEDMSKAAEKKMNEMLMILKGLRKSIVEPDREKMYNGVIELFSKSWIPIVFPSTNGMGVLTMAGKTGPIAITMLMGRRQKKFPKLMDKLIRITLNDGTKDSLVQLRKQAAGR